MAHDGPVGSTLADLSQERVETLRRLPLWKTFSDETLLVVANAMGAVSYKAGETIIQGGEPGRHLSVLISGRADVRIRTAGGTVTTVSTIGEGSSFGEMSLLSEDVTSADVIAVEDCDTLSLGRAAFHALISENPVLLREFVRLLSQRVKASDVAIHMARQKERDLTRLLQEQGSGQDAVLIGKARAIQELKKQIDAKVGLRTPLLVRGEKGTGKELFARLVHRRGPRKDAPLVAVDCGKIAESQWGDQLFGLYDQAAAADARGLSYLGLADGGTLLLENVQAMPPGVQERLVRFLKGEPLPTGSRPDVRVIATCRTNLLEEAVAGRFSPELSAILLGDVLEVPPLRERKRDIPELAAHFVKKHALRHGKQVPVLGDQALTRLVSYDYAFANVHELEEAIERAVIITDGDTILPEVVFLGPPPRQEPRGFNLLSLPQPLVRLGLRFFPAGARAMVALFFALVVLLCFAAPAPWGGVGTFLVWAVWWPVLVVSFFVAGRLWCAVCPMAATGDVVQGLVRRFARLEQRVPGWLKEHDVTFVMAGFFLVSWVEEVTAMRHSPVATGFLLLAILTGAVATSAFLPRRSWCRHLCPVGGLAGLCSTSGLLELRPTQDICAARCTGHSCFKGDAAVDGCPMFQHVMFVESSRDCVLCLNCVRLCPNGSPQLNLRLPARELWSGATPRPELTRLVGMLLGLLLGQALIQYGESNAVLSTWAHGWLETNRFVSITALLLLSAALPLVLLLLVERRFDQRPDPAAQALHRLRMTCTAPLLGAGFAAFHFGNIPGFEKLRLTLGGLSMIPWLPDPLLTIGVLPASQTLALAVGLALTVAALWKTWPANSSGEGLPWYRGQAFSLLAVTAYAAVLLVVLVLRPRWLPL